MEGKDCHRTHLAYAGQGTITIITGLQSLREWLGDSEVTIAGQWLEAGKYLLQLALDPGRSQCEVGQHGTIPFDLSWKMQLLATAEAKACPIVPDDSKQKFSQVRLRQGHF